MPRRRYLDNAAPADNTANIVRPINRMIQVKQKDTPARRAQMQHSLRNIKKAKTVNIEKYNIKPTGITDYSTSNFGVDSILTPADSISVNLPNVTHTFNRKDKETIDLFKKHFGKYRRYAYNDLSSINRFPQYDSVFDPSIFIRKLDTITSRSANPMIFLSPEIARFAESVPYKDGSKMRAFTLPILPDAPMFLDPNGKDFLNTYISELAHTFQFRTKDYDRPSLKGDVSGIWLGKDAHNKSYRDKNAAEFRAHHVIEPSLFDYLITGAYVPSNSYDDYYFGPTNHISHNYKEFLNEITNKFNSPPFTQVKIVNGKPIRVIRPDVKNVNYNKLYKQ